MTNPPSELRTVTVKARTAIRDHGPALWVATIVVGQLNHPDNQVEPKGPADDIFRSSTVRVVAQDADPVVIDVEGQARPRFHGPRLIQAALRARDNDNDSGSSPSQLTVHGGGDSPGKDRTAELHPCNQAAYSDVLLGLNDGIKSKSGIEIELPELTLEAGAIETLLRLDQGGIAKWLGVGHSTPPKIFGEHSNLTIEKTHIKDGAYLPVWLVPEGIEFCATVTDPFALPPSDGAEAPAPLKLRLLLTYDCAFSQFMLRARATRETKAATQTLRASFDALMAEFSGDGVPLLAEVKPTGLPFAWSLGPGAAGDSLDAGTSRICIDREAIRVRLNSEAPGGSTIPAVCQAQVRTASIVARTLRIECDANDQTVSNATTAALPAGAAVATFMWQPQMAAAISVDPGTAPQVIDTAEFKQRMQKRYAASGLPVEEHTPLYAFLPLERGMLQLPMAAPPLQPPVRATGLSAFSGLIRSRTPISTGRDVLVEITAAVHVLITVELPLRRTTAIFTGARGTATGLVFAAAASPNPTSILPPLDAGPVACEPLDIVFGDAQIQSEFSVNQWRIAPNQPKLEVTIVVMVPEEFHAVAWLAHPRIALVSTMPMTRTRFDATRPSSTRDLFPFVIVPGEHAFVLTTVLNDENASPFPELGALAAGDALIGLDPKWPWPDKAEDTFTIGKANNALSNVSVSWLTLPGIELTLNGPDWSDLLASLRYDLPILGELFASAALPKSPAANAFQAGNGQALPKSPAAANAFQTCNELEHAPTALEQRALTDHWKLVANRHALSRTINDRATGWVALGAAADKTPLTTLVEPYEFLPDFAVAIDSKGLPLGTLELLGKTMAGGDALAGWSGTLTSGGIAIDFVGFSARLYQHQVAGSSAQIDARGFGQAIMPRPQTLLPPGFALRDTVRLDLNGVLADRVALTATHIGFRFGGVACGLRLRDLPMIADGNGNLAFTPTRPNGQSRELLGPEGALGPEGSVFERPQLLDAVFEWSFYQTADAAGTPSFVCRLGALDLRPLRLTSVTFVNEAAGLRLSGFEMIANVEPPTRGSCPGGLIDDDKPYATGNPVAFAFSLSGEEATLNAVHPVRVQDRKILIDPEDVAKVKFSVGAELEYGADNANPGYGANLRANGRLPIVLGMQLRAGGGNDRLVVASPELTAVLFGSQTKVLFNTITDCLTFDYQATVMAQPLLQLRRIAFTWSRGARSPTLLLSARLGVPAAAVPAALHTDVTGNIVEWQVGSTLRWFGAKVSSQGLADGDYCNFDADHAKGTLNLSVSVQSLPGDAAFLQGWPLATRPFTLALAVAFQSDTVAAPFLFAPSAGFVEATCGIAKGPYIRHRSVIESRIAGSPSGWSTRILISLAMQDRTSAIAWPLDGLPATFAKTFQPNSRKAEDWRVEVVVGGDNPHTHQVKLAVRDAEMPAAHLVVSGEVVRLKAPWMFPAMATHNLRNATTVLTWTSVDEIVVGYVSALECEATETLAHPPGALGFVARYRQSAVGKLKDFAVSAGVFSRAMARAGIPTLEMLIALGPGQNTQATREKTDSAGDLFISGGALIEVAEVGDDTMGHRIVTPWIAPLFDGGTLGKLGSIPQAPWEGQVSSYDLAPYTASRLDRETVLPFSTSDASVAGIRHYRERMAQSMPSQFVPRFEPVSQAIIEDVELMGNNANSPNDPTVWLKRPIWLRTLAAWKGVLASTPTTPLVGRTVTVQPILKGDPQASQRTTAIRLAIQRLLDSEPVGADLVAETDMTWRPESCYEVIVLTRKTVEVVAVANDEARMLNEGQATVDGEGRKRLAQLAFSIPEEPLAAALGQLTDAPASLLTEDQIRNRTHCVREFLRLPAYLDPVQSLEPLRDRERTVFPSATLAWPRAAVHTQPAALAFGDQRPLQDGEYSWAGDVRCFSVPGAAPALEPGAMFRHASILTIGQRALFRRRADEDLTAPPDRALIPVPPRARVPMPHSIELALSPQRLRTDSQLEKAIASIQPAHFEIVTTGRRPGILFFQYDGLSFADSVKSFDAHQPRFGRPADRGPVVYRQTRAPRSTAYNAANDNLSQRRQTFIGSDFLGNGHLLPCILAKDSMTALRILGADDSAPTVKTILLRLARTDAAPFSISGDWDGTLKLTATVYAGQGNDAAITELANAGLAGKTRFVLVVRGREFDFSEALFGTATPNPNFEHHGTSAFDVPIRLSWAPADKALVQSTLRSADADSTASLMLSLPVAGAGIPAGLTSNLTIGPPRALSLPIPVAPFRQPSLPIQTATVVFGDPAYDRELSSKTATAIYQLQEKSYLLALDRLEYDLNSVIYFAAGLVVKQPSTDPIKAGPDWGEPEQMTLQLGLLRKATPAALQPSPLCVAKTDIFKGVSPPGHQFVSGQAYKIGIADLQEVVPNAEGSWRSEPQALSPPIVPGDRIVVTASWPQGSMQLEVTIVAEPVLSPPSAVYGLATLDQCRDGNRLTSSLFATAPQPQIVEFEDLAGDLAKGLIRRRAVFVWPFYPRTMPAPEKPYGALLKFDRAGGGQLPNCEADFLPLLS